jgi:peptidoglycan/xylan/chitin deacetylase (PgdA/CDA1 family)
MGGRVGDSIAIMTWLVSHRVRGTIFLTGEIADSAATDAGRQVLSIIDAHPDLLDLGNHSYTHRDFRLLSAAQIGTELARTETALARYCSQTPRPIFRPPYGGYNTAVLAGVGAAGYSRTVLWQIDTIDWRPIVNDPPGPTADQIVSKVVGNAQNGSIVLMHLGGYETLKALPGVVTGLQVRGLSPVTIGTMIGK